MANEPAGGHPAFSIPLSHSALSRRALMRGAVAATGAVTVPSLLAACSSKSGGSTDSKSITLGSNYSDAVPKKALADAAAPVLVVTDQPSRLAERLTAHVRSALIVSGEQSDEGLDAALLLCAALGSGPPLSFGEVVGSLA